MAAAPKQREHWVKPYVTYPARQTETEKSSSGHFPIYKKEVFEDRQKSLLPNGKKLLI